MVKDHTITIFILMISSLMLISDVQILCEKREKIGKIRVYVHDVVSGPNATVHEVARAGITSTSPTFFGQLLVADDLMTAGPDPDSPKLGRAQGMVVNSGLEVLSFILNGVFIFTDGEYKGSKVNLMGWKEMGEEMEIPIVGGTGVFKRAQGHAVSTIYSHNPHTNNYVWIFDLYVYYHL